MRANPSTARSLVYVAFAAIAALLLADELYGYLGASASRDEADAIVRDALTSVRLVDHIGMDLQAERVLVSRHILEHTEIDMKQVERRLANVRRDYAETARVYAPLTNFPGEADAWQKLTADVALIDERLSPALALSHQNRDAEASELLFALDPVYERIEHEIDGLVGINHVASERALVEASAIRARQLYIRLAIDIAVLAIVLVGGMLVARQIVRAHEALEERNRELDAFAGRVAHDLRGPLGTLGVSATMLASANVKLSGVVERTIARMSSLIDDLLQLSRAGLPASDAVPVAPVVAAVEAELAPLVAGAEGTLVVDVEPADVRGSADLLRQVLWNLGENAVKYRRFDAQLHLELVGRVTRRAYELRVSDNGVGMSSADASHAFDPFYRGAETRARPGTGLGLSIVRRIIETSGGHISIASKPGEGTTFVVDLPIAK